MSDNRFKEKAAEYIRKHCKADDYSFQFNQTDSHETRFAQNMITQHMNGSKYSIVLEVAFGNKTGTAVVNQPDEEHLQYLIDTAEQMAILNQPDPEHMPSQTQQKLPDVNNYSDATAALSTDDMVSVVHKCVANANKIDAKISGMTSRHVDHSYMITKNGFEGEDRGTSFEHSMTMKRGEVETKISRGVKDFACYSIESEIDRLNNQFSSLSKPQPIQPGKYPVILRSQAVDNFYQFLGYMMDLRSADEGTSAFSDQIGKQFFGKDFTLRSTIGDPDLHAPRYDYEGAPSRETYWVRNGMLENMPVSRYYANQKGIEPCTAYNMLIEGGNATEEEMMKIAGSGIIVNHLWYIRFVNAKRGELTGMTRDGVLWFEDGKIKHPIVNLRFNEVIYESTRRIMALGKPEVQSPYSKVPTMLIDGFNFVDTTSF